MSTRQSKLILLLLAVTGGVAQADVRLPGIFSDHMVLQQGQTLPVWDWADAAEEVCVALGAETKKTQAGADGKWRVDLPKTAASRQSQRLVIAGKNTLTIEDVLVGEVWLCSGQSNMEYGVLNGKKKEDFIDPELRVFCLTKSASLTPIIGAPPTPWRCVQPG
jgi:sialate O-acetylesterase